MKFILLSVLLHVSVILLLLYNTSGLSQSKQSEEGMYEVTLNGQVPYTTIIPKEEDGDKKCLFKYGGIGFVGSAYVVSVTVGYPAYRAGIRAGDTLYSDEEIVGKPGTQVKIRWHKKSNMQEYTEIVLTREEICVE